jgi:hypothetical protein
MFSLFFCFNTVSSQVMFRICFRRLGAATPEPKRMQFVRNLPWYAQTSAIPKEWKLFGFATIAPLWMGGIAVHALESDSDTNSREIMGFTLHYASVVVGAQAALHWGMQAVQFGLPTHTVEFTPLYRFMRFGLPVVPLTVCILASRLSTEDPRAASIVLMCLAAASTGADWFSYAFATSPVWYPRFQWYWAMSVMGSLFLLMLSDRMKIRGEMNAEIREYNVS